MMKNRAEWASDHAQITKIWLSELLRRENSSSGGGIWVGADLKVIWERSDKDGQIACHIADPV